MKYVKLGLLATGLAVLAANPASSDETPICKDIVTPAMIEAACGVSMKPKGGGKQDAKQCYITFEGPEKNDLLLQIFSANSEGDAQNRFERKRKSAERRSDPAKAEQRKADGQSYLESYEVVAGIGQQAFATKTVNPGTNKHSFQIHALTGLHEVQLNAQFGLLGKSTPCDAAQLKALGEAVLGAIGG